MKLKESLALTGKSYLVGELVFKVEGREVSLGEVAQLRVRFDGEGPYAHVQFSASPRQYGGVLETSLEESFLEGLPEEAIERMVSEEAIYEDDDEGAV